MLSYSWSFWALALTLKLTYSKKNEFNMTSRSLKRVFCFQVPLRFQSHQLGGVPNAIRFIRVSRFLFFMMISFKSFVTMM